MPMGFSVIRRSKCKPLMRLVSSYSPVTFPKGFQEESALR